MMRTPRNSSVVFMLLKDDPKRNMLGRLGGKDGGKQGRDALAGILEGPCGKVALCHSD